MLILPDTLPTQLWDLSAVLTWAELSPLDSYQSISIASKELFIKPWVRYTELGARTFFIGTRKFGNGERVLLLDAPSIVSIQRDRPDIYSSPPTPLPTSLYMNLSQCLLPNRRAVNTKLRGLKMSNGKRTRSVLKREDMLNEVRGANLGDAVALSVAKVGRKKRVAQVEWATINQDREVVARQCCVQELSAPRRLKSSAAVDLQESTFTLAAARSLLSSDLAPSAILIGNTSRLPVNLPGVGAGFTGKQYDIVQLYRAARRDQNYPTTTMKDMLDFYKIPYDKTAHQIPGNQAIYILQIFIALVKTC